MGLCVICHLSSKASNIKKKNKKGGKKGKKDPVKWQKLNLKTRENRLNDWLYIMSHFRR